MSSLLMFWHDCCVCMEHVYVCTYILQSSKYFFFLLDTTVCSFPFVNQVLYTMLHVVSYTIGCLIVLPCSLLYVTFLDFLHGVLLCFLYVLMICMFSTCYLYIYSHLVLYIVLCSVSLVLSLDSDRCRRRCVAFGYAICAAQLQLTFH